MDIDDRIRKLRTARDALTLAGNARRYGQGELEEKARQRATELRAVEEGFASPAELAIAQALYAYEEEQSRLTGRTFRANRTRKMLRDHTPRVAAERMVLNSKPSEGYRVLEETGRQELSFEAIIDRYPEEFDPEAVKAARARLAGEVYSPPRRSRKVEAAPAMAAPDEEAARFVAGFVDPRNPQFVYWRPRYEATLATVKVALARDAHAELFELIWKSRDNSVSNAGQGVMGFELADRLRDRLVGVIREIAQDGCPEQFDVIVARFEQWRSAGEITNVPRLLIARAFAAIHPDRYHTTVDGPKQERILPWFTEHTGFAVSGGSWAAKAAALSAHMDHWGVFGGNLALRNMFPWFVFEQMRDASGKVPFHAGHTPRSGAEQESERPARSLMLTRRHNLIQNRLYAMLCEQYGEAAVATEHPTGTGGRADALVRHGDGRYDLYEIKPAACATEAVRQAMGQLLEYAFRRGGLEPASLCVVSEPSLDDVTDEFLKRMNKEFGLKLRYLQMEGIGVIDGAVGEI